MELTEFFKARLDEAERDIDSRDHDSGQCDYLRGIHLEPGRALREVAAMRAILELHQPNALGGCLTCMSERSYDRQEMMADDWPCETVRALAAVWSDHPGYRAERAPES